MPVHLTHSWFPPDAGSRKNALLPITEAFWATIYFVLSVAALTVVWIQ